MKAKLYVILVLFIIVIPGLFAEKCIIEYLEGTLEIKDGNNWTEVEEGAEIPMTTLLRTTDDTFVELSYNHNLYTISAKGTYSLQSIFDSSEDASSWDIVNVIEKKLAYIVKDDIEKVEAVMAVRGEDFGNFDEIEWMEHSELVVWKGKLLINEGKYDEALSHFQKALIESFEDEVDEYLFYIGYCYSLLGEKTLALVTLSKVNVNENADYFGTFVLLKARLFAESLSYEKALSLIDKYLELYPDGDNAQAANFLSAYCFEGLKQRVPAIKRLKRAIELDPVSPIGKEAKKKLEMFDAE